MVAIDYNNETKERLISRITELENLLEQLLTEKEEHERLDYAWAGNLGHWYWDVESNTVTFNSLKVTTLGYELHEIPDRVGYQFFTEMIHPEDYHNTMEAMLKHLRGEKEIYETEYRIRSKDGSWKWYSDRGKVTKRNLAGEPLFLAGIVFDVTRQKEESKQLSYESFLEKGSLTKRELDVAKCLLEGYSYDDVAEKLFISVSTVKKHIGEIYKKMNTNSRAGFMSMFHNYEKV